MKAKCDHRSKCSNLSNWKEEAWKKSGFLRDSNPWPSRYRCDALPTELWSHTLGARSIYWVHICPCSEMMWSLSWNNSYLYCGYRWQRRVIIAANFPIWAIGKKKPEKNQGFNDHGFECRWSHDFVQASSFQLLKLENLLRWSLFASFLLNLLVHVSYPRLVVVKLQQLY